MKVLNKSVWIFLLITSSVLGIIGHDIELVAGLGYPSIVHASFTQYKGNWGSECLIGYIPMSDRELFLSGYRKIKQLKIGTGLYHRTFNGNPDIAIPEKFAFSLSLSYSFDSPFSFNSSIDLKTRIDCFQSLQPFEISHSTGIYLSYTYRIKTSEWGL